MQQVGADRTHHAERVDAEMRIEAAVLDRKECLAAGTRGNSRNGTAEPLKANSGSTVTIKPPASGACEGKACFVFLIEYGAYIVIDGFILDGLNTRHDAIKLYSHHVRVQNSEIKDPFGNCVYTSGGDTYHEFINLNVHACGIRDVEYGGHNSFYITGNHNLVANSTVHDGDAGIMAWHDVHNPSFNVFRDNKVYNMAGGTGLGVGIGLNKGTDNKAINNVVWGIDGPGINARYGCSACQILNNTVYGSTGGPYHEGFGIEIGAGVTNAVVKNNIAWGNSQADISNLGTGTSLSNNLCAIAPCTITQNPMFVDAANKNFRLQSNSPAVNAGVNLAPTVMTDMLGTPRPQDSGYDIGAYEVTSQSSDTTPPAAPRNVRIQ